MYCLLWIRRTVKRWFRFKPSKQKLVQLWAITSTVLLFLSFFCLWRALDTLNRFEHAEPQTYSERGKQISVTLPSDRSYLLLFGKKDVKIDHCIGSSRQDALDLVSFVKGYASEREIAIPRSTVELIGEYRLHTILSAPGYKREQTAVVDLDYDQDRRWYINTLSKLVGIIGV